MGVVSINDIIITPLKKVTVEGGDVFHGMKSTDPGYYGFGEAYFSQIAPQKIKGWKRHKEMTLNLIVIEGKVRFVARDNKNNYKEIILSPVSHYARLTVPPGIWLAFQGQSSTTSTVLNLANQQHDPKECDAAVLTEFDYPFD